MAGFDEDRMFAVLLVMATVAVVAAFVGAAIGAGFGVWWLAH